MLQNNNSCVVCQLCFTAERKSQNLTHDFTATIICTFVNWPHQKRHLYFRRSAAVSQDGLWSHVRVIIVVVVMGDPPNPGLLPPPPTLTWPDDVMAITLSRERIMWWMGGARPSRWRSVLVSTYVFCCTCCNQRNFEWSQSDISGLLF